MSTLRGSASKYNPVVPPHPPNPVQIARGLLLAVGVTHIVVPLVMLHSGASLGLEIAKRHPEFDVAQTQAAVAVALRAAIGFHAALLLLSAGLAILLAKPRKAIRRLTIVSQLMAVVFSAVSWRSSTMFHGLIPIVDAAEIAIVLLVLLPHSTRVFYAQKQFN